MAGEKTVGRLVGWLIFYRIGWQRFVSLTVALVVGWIVAGCIVGAALWAVPRLSFPAGDPILDDKFLTPERWQSNDPGYVARRLKAEAEHDKAMEQYDAAVRNSKMTLNIVAGVGVLAGCVVAPLVFRLARRRVFADPAFPPTFNDAV